MENERSLENTPSHRRVSSPGYGSSRKGVPFDAPDGKGSATVPVASSGVPPDESVREDAFGEDAERGGRDARATLIIQSRIAEFQGI